MVSTLLTSKVSRAVNIPIIASGGVGQLEHSRRAYLKVKLMLYLQQVSSTMVN